MSDGFAYVLENLTVAHEGRIALNLPHCEVRRGEILCLVGPPGAGKSTLLRLLAGLDGPTSGRMTLNGERFDEGPASLALRRRVTLVFQRPMLLRGTVRQNVEFGLKIRRVQDRVAKVMAILEKVHLTHLADRPTKALSGGEAQLIALARALAFRPDVLLLDEPTNNLDPARVAIVEEVVMADHHERGTTVVWATHNHFQARRVGDRALLLLDGKVVEAAAPAEFFDKPRDPRTAAFVQGKMVY